jgi:hypothetical protein
MMSLVPSNDNGIPFNTLAVLTFYSGIIYTTDTEEVYRLAHLLEGGPVITHHLSKVMDKHAAYLAACFPAMASLTHESLDGKPLSIKLDASSKLIEALGPTLMIKLPTLSGDQN